MGRVRCARKDRVGAQEAADGARAGCGAGLPSLYASIVLESPRVVATDVEAVPLAFLKAARSAHAPVDLFRMKPVVLRCRPLTLGQNCAPQAPKFLLKISFI